MTRLAAALLVLSACGADPAAVPCEPCAGVYDAKMCRDWPACDELPIEEQRARAVDLPCGTLAPRCLSGGRVFYVGPARLSVPDDVPIDAVCPALSEACWPWAW